MKEKIHCLQQRILAGDRNEVCTLCRELLEGGMLPMEIVTQGLLPCMDTLGVQLARREKFIPQILMSARAVQSGIDFLSPYLVGDGSPSLAETVVLGTVSGDIHTIGKTLVSIMLRSAGFRVVDLGTNVPPEAFVKAVRENNARIIAISAMLTTTVTGMKKTIRVLREAEGNDAWHIIVGGAPVNGRFAREHAVEYAADAVETVNLALKVCGIRSLPNSGKTSTENEKEK